MHTRIHFCRLQTCTYDVIAFINWARSYGICMLSLILKKMNYGQKELSAKSDSLHLECKWKTGVNKGSRWYTKLKIIRRINFTSGLTLWHILILIFASCSLWTIKITLKECLWCNVVKNFKHIILMNSNREYCDFLFCFNSWWIDLKIFDMMLFFASFNNWHGVDLLHHLLRRFFTPSSKNPLRRYFWPHPQQKMDLTSGVKK